MRIACVLIEHFAAAVAEQQRPELCGSPFVIGGYPHERKPVYDFSPAAALCGVEKGIPLREASQRCPQATFLQTDEVEYQRVFASIMATLAEFTPAIEAGEQGRVYLDLRYLALPPGGEPTLAGELLAATRAVSTLVPGVGLAHNPFVAGVAADQAGPRRTLVVAHGQERAFLAPLPLSILPLGDEARRRLRLLGLTTVGALASLPAEAAAAQLGAEGAAAHRLANGIDERRIGARQRTRSVREEREFDEPLADGERLRLAFAHLVDQLLPRLQRDFLFCRRVAVGLRLVDGHELALATNLREPTQDGETIVRAACRLAANAACSAGIVALNLSLEGLGGVAGRQLSLFAPHQGRLEKLVNAVSQLQVSLGNGRLRKAVVLDAAAPLPERRFALVEYR
jgi:DNA polymerase IV